MLSTLIMAASAGLLSTLHCWGMCGGIVAALSLGAGSGQTARLPLALAYNLGRIASYAGMGAAAAVPQLSLSSDSVLRMLILNAPPLLLIGFFCLREVPRIEIPPLPRPLRQSAWQHAAGAALAPSTATLST